MKKEVKIKKTNRLVPVKVCWVRIDYLVVLQSFNEFQKLVASLEFLVIALYA